MVFRLKELGANMISEKGLTNTKCVFNERFCLENLKNKSRSSEMKFSC